MPVPAYEYKHINPQLLRLPYWLLHKEKKPFYASGRPRSGKLGSPEDLAKLVRHEDAVKAFNKGGYSGIGLAICEGLHFIDLDHCRDLATGELQPWALSVKHAAEAMGAFVEISLSGTGLHIVGIGGDLPTHKGNQIEVYTHGRYMALGTLVLAGGNDPLPDLAPLMKVMADRMLPATPKPAPSLRVIKSTPMLFAVEEASTRKAIGKLNPDMTYPDWRDVGMALHEGSGGSQQGLDMWENWSKGGEKWVEGKCAQLWAGFKPGGGITMGTLHHMAQQAEKPKSSRVKATGPVEDAFVRKTRYTLDELLETDFPPTPWLAEGLLAPGLTLLAAPPKMGKSYLVMQMGMAVALGKPFLGRQTRQAKVAYFNLEEWPDLVTERAHAIKRGMGHPGKVPLMHLVFKLDPDVEIEDEIEAQVEAGVELIIIDLLARVRDEMGEDAKKNAYTRDYNALSKFSDIILQRFPHLAIVIVHHTNKGQHDDWQSKISGSQGLAGASHCNMVLGNLDLRGMDDEGRKDALRHRRFYAAGKLVQGQEMMLVQMPDMGGWAISDKTEDEVKASGKTLHVLQLLREANGAWVSAKQLHDEVEGTLDALKKLLQRMHKKRLIESAGQGGAGYRITPDA